MGYEILNDDLYSEEELHKNKNKTHKKKSVKKTIKITGILLGIIIFFAIIFAGVNFFNDLFKQENKNFYITGEFEETKQEFEGDLIIFSNSYSIITESLNTKSSAEFLTLEHFSGDFLITNNSVIISGKAKSFGLDSNEFSINDKEIFIEVTKPLTLNIINGNYKFNINKGNVKFNTKEDDLKFNFKYLNSDIKNFSGDVVIQKTMSLVGTVKSYILRKHYKGKELLFVYG